MPAEKAIFLDEVSRSFRRRERRSGLGGMAADLLRPRFSKVEAVKQISLAVSRGEFVGLIGANGAGKSTLIKVICGVLQPDGGKVRTLGLDPFWERKSCTRRMSALFGQRSQLWPEISVEDSLGIIADIYGVKSEDYQRRLPLLAGLLSLGHLLPVSPRQLSLGERARCDLAAALIHQPELLILDEPGIGLDIEARDALRRFYASLPSTFGTTVLLSSHDLHEVEAICSRILFMHKGALIFDGNMEELRSRVGNTEGDLEELVRAFHVA